jgi:hypothetical protein
MLKPDHLKVWEVDLEESGASFIRSALPEAQRRALLDELSDAEFKPIKEFHPESQVTEQYDWLDIRLPSKRFPQVSALGDDLSVFFKGVGFAPNSAAAQRYLPSHVGVTPHRDPTKHKILVAVFTLEGTTEFSIVRDRAGKNVAAVWTVEPGSLALLRAPGFKGVADGRPMHRVLPPKTGRRISLTYRMTVKSR